MAGVLSEIIGELERQRRVIDRALAALRDLDGIEPPAAEAAAGGAIPPPVGAVRKENDTERLGTSRGKRSTAKKAGEAPPTVDASASDFRNRLYRGNCTGLSGTLDVPARISG